MLRSLFAFLFFVFAQAAMPASAADNSKQLLVHYMPWYATKDVSGAWGWHWTMNHFHPDRVSSEGRHEIASHDHPLIGPYDSADPAALECQVLLMKVAGIDGVIIDWYGTAEFNDYAMIHRNTAVLVPFLKNAGLHFAICYEDQSVSRRIKAKVLNESEAVAAGKQSLQWLDEHWFKDEAYLRQDGRPVLLVFGPQCFRREQWRELRAAMPAAMPANPIIFGLAHLAKETGLDGPFVWPPVAGGKDITPGKWHAEVERVSARGQAGESMIAGAFPGFNDIYQQAGVGESYGHIDHQGGRTLAESLELALKSPASLVQIATWNDYGEGTVVEPTLEGGYHYLEIIQAKARDLHPSRRSFSPDDLRLPVLLYNLRQRCRNDTGVDSSLDRVATLLYASEIRQARTLIKEVQDQVTTKLEKIK